MFLFSNQVQEVHTILPYHQLMTPKWIHDHAILTTPHSLYSQYIEFPSGVQFERMLRQQLVPPNVLSSTDSVAITITIAMDTQVANSADHDLQIGISDGASFVGFVAPDKDNYPSISPCVLREADISTGILQNGAGGSGPLVASRRYSGEIRIQIKPTEKWGSCHTEHDEGYTNIANYRRLLDLTKGLYLDMYRQGPLEKYRIKYIVVDINLD